MNKKFIVTNFAYGTGPYLRATDLAIAFNEELAKVDCPRLGIIVPWVYGEKQKRIMLEEFSAHEKKYPGEIFLDAKLGQILKDIFYGDNIYKEALSKWVRQAKASSEKARRYLCGQIQTETLSGEKLKINGQDIIVELNRSPRISYGVTPSYFTSFAYVADILNYAAGEKSIATDNELLKAGIKIADSIERSQRIHCIAYPATFSYLGNRPPRYKTELEVPPIAPPPKENNDEIDPGIFVTVTGIPGLERLYAEAKKLGLKLYSNDTNAIPGSVHALPRIIPNKNIVFQFARSGWSSVWISMISGTPLIVPDFDFKDDPEIYFNNKTIEKLGLGLVYKGQSLKELLSLADQIKKTGAKIKNEILRRWGTLDGNRYCAQLFVKNFLKTGC